MNLDAVLDRVVPLAIVVLALDTLWAVGSALGLIHLSGLPMTLAIALNVPVLLAAGIWLLRNHRHI